MICSSCLASTIAGKLEMSIACSIPRDYRYLNEFFKKLKLDDGKGICSVCRRPIIQNEPSYAEGQTLIDNVIEEVGKVLTNKIVCCEQCDVGETYESFSHSLMKSCDDVEEFNESMNYLTKLKSSRSIEDLIGEYFDDDCWLPYLIDIAEKIYCPNCGNGSGENYDEKINYGVFDQYTEVYTKDDRTLFNSKFYGDEFDNPNEFIENICEQFSMDEISSIVENYNIGITIPEVLKLEQFIKTLFDSGFLYKLNADRLLYRARPIDSGKKYTPSEMWEPPIGMASRGRYNKAGWSVLYCSNSVIAVKAEVKKEVDSVYSIGKFLVNESMILFPINAVFAGAYADYISKKESPSKKEYVLTNLVSSICQRVGYNGIVYCSVREKDYLNYALFCTFTKGKELDCIDVFSES